MKKDKIFLLLGSSLLMGITGLCAYLILKPEKKVPNPGQCEGLTRDGSRCHREAAPDSRYCWQHQPAT